MSDQSVNTSVSSETANPSNTSQVEQKSQNLETQETENYENVDLSGTHGHSTEEAIDADPNLTKKQKEEAKKTLRKLKIKFNNKEYEEELPFEIPDDPEVVEFMKNKLQMAKLAHQKAQEYSQLDREAREFIELLKTNPRAILEDPRIGIDLKKLAAEIVQEEIENAKKTPEQLEKERLEKELQALKEQYEREKMEAQKKEFERLQAQEFERYDREIQGALESAQLPKSPYIVKKIADYLYIGLQNGIDLSPKDVIPIVREEIEQEIKDYLNSLKEDEIEKVINKDLFDKYRKKQLAKAKNKPPIPLKSQIKDVGEKIEKPKQEKPKTYKEIFGF
jgi:hypothetical protein